MRLLITFLRLNLAQSHVVTRTIIHKDTLQIYLHFPRVPEEFCTSLLVPRLPYFQAILSRTSNENWGITSEKMTSLLTEANVTHSKKAHRKDTAQYFDKFIVLLIYYLLYFISINQSNLFYFTPRVVALFFFLISFHGADFVEHKSSSNPHWVSMCNEVYGRVRLSYFTGFYSCIPRHGALNATPCILID